MDGSMMNYPPGDPRLVDRIVCQLKSQGIFDRFRKECIADVDTKPAYQNLHQRVEGTVTGFLANQEWRQELNKNQLRDSLRKHIHESGFLDIGVERIVDQVVNPKILTVLLPQIEDVVYNFLGLEKPKKRFSQNVASLQSAKNFKPLKMETLEDLLPKDLDPISPGSVGVNSDDDDNDFDVKKEVKDEPGNEDEKICDEEESSPPFEPIENPVTHDESSLDSHLSGISGLTSHDSQMSNLSFGGECRPVVEQNTIQKIPHLDLSNQDSQLSKVSSGSRLSIVFSDEQEKSDNRTSPATSDMDIQNEDSQLTNLDEPMQHEPESMDIVQTPEESNTIIDSDGMKEIPADVAISCASPVEGEEGDQFAYRTHVFEECGEKIVVREEYSDINKEYELDDKKIDDKDKRRDRKDDRKRSSASTDSRDSKKSESTSHSSDSERRKTERDRILKGKEFLKDDDKKEIKIRCEEKTEKEREENRIEDHDKIKKEDKEKDVKNKIRPDDKMEVLPELVKENDRNDEKDKLKERSKSEAKVERDSSRDRSKHDEKDGIKDKNRNDEKVEKSKNEKGLRESNKDRTKHEDKAEKDIRKSHHEEKNKDHSKEKSKHEEKDVSKEKTEKESSKDKRHDDKNKDVSKEKLRSLEKENVRDKQKDEKSDRDSHKEKLKSDEKTKKDISKDKTKHEKSERENSRDRSKHEGKQERTRSRHEGKEKKEDKSKVDDKLKRNDKEGNKEKAKKEVHEGTKNEDVEEEKKNKSRSDPRKDKEKYKEKSSRHSDKSKSDKSKQEEKSKEIKSDSKESVPKQEIKSSNDKSAGKDAKSKSRNESKDKDEKKEVKKEERSKEKSKEDKGDKDKPREDRSDKDKCKEDRGDKDKSKEHRSDKDKYKEELEKPKDDRDKSREEKSDKDKHKDEKADKEKTREERNDKEKTKEDKEKSKEDRPEKDKSSRSSHSSKENDTSKKSDRESASKSRSSSSGGGDKGKEGRKKESKARPASDDHPAHRERRSDDRRSTDRDSNGAARGQSANARGSGGGGDTTHNSRRHERRSADGGSGSGGGSGGGGGGKSESGGSNSDATDGTEARGEQEPTQDDVVSHVLPIKKRPVQSPEAGEATRQDEYACVNNAGKLVLKLKKPKIAANIFEVRKIMHLRKSMAKIERKKQRGEARSHQISSPREPEPDTRPQSPPEPQTPSSPSSPPGPPTVPTPPVLSAPSSPHALSTQPASSASSRLAPPSSLSSTELSLKTAPHVATSDSDDEEVRFFTEEEARPDEAFLRFVRRLEESETLSELAYSDDEEMLEEQQPITLEAEIQTQLTASVKTEDSPIKSETVDVQERSEPSGAMLLASVTYDAKAQLRSQESPTGKIKIESPMEKTENTHTPVVKPDSYTPGPRIRIQPTIGEKRDRRKRDIVHRRETPLRDVRTRTCGAADGASLSPPPDSESAGGAARDYLPHDIGAVLGIDSGLNVTITKARSPPAAAAVPVPNPAVARVSVLAPSPVPALSPTPRGRSSKRRAAPASPAPGPTPDESTPKRARSDGAATDVTAQGPRLSGDIVAGIVALEEPRKGKDVASSAIICPPVSVMNRTPSLGLRKAHSAKTISSGIISYSSFIPKEIVEVKVLDVDGEGEEYPGSIKENNNVDKSSSDDEKGCGEDMSLSKELISTALRDLMMESGLNLGGSLAAPPAPPASSAPLTLADGGAAAATQGVSETSAAAATGASRRIKAARGRRMGLPRPARRASSASATAAGADAASPNAGDDFALPLSPSSDSAAPAVDSKAADGAREGSAGAGVRASSRPGLAGDSPGGRRQLRGDTVGNTAPEQRLANADLQQHLQPNTTTKCQHPLSTPAEQEPLAEYQHIERSFVSDNPPVVKRTRR